MRRPNLSDEDRREQREDERLNERDQDFEEHDEQRHRDRRDGAMNQPNMKIRPISARMITWPAIMFAKRRIVSANGFVNFPMISTGVMMIVNGSFEDRSACRAASR